MKDMWLARSLWTEDDLRSYSHSKMNLLKSYLHPTNVFTIMNNGTDVVKLGWHQSRGFVIS